MAVLQDRRPGSLRASDPRTKPFTPEAWTEKTRDLPPNVVDWPTATPDIMLVALRPYRAYPEVIEHMAQLDAQRLRRTF